MSFEIRGRGEPFMTEFALPWFLASVNQLVFLQMSQLSEGFLTFIAVEWSLASMNPSMHLNITVITLL